jgi:hypothetical protein
MFVTVIHRIHDPKGFEAAEAKALEAGLPSHVALPIHASNDDHTFGICIWEGESVESVREVVEGAVGSWANNEYIEMHVRRTEPAVSLLGTFANLGLTRTTTVGAGYRGRGAGVNRPVRRGTQKWPRSNSGSGEPGVPNANRQNQQTEEPTDGQFGKARLESSAGVPTD